MKKHIFLATLMAMISINGQANAVLIGDYNVNLQGNVSAGCTFTNTQLNVDLGALANNSGVFSTNTKSITLGNLTCNSTGTVTFKSSKGALKGQSVTNCTLTGTANCVLYDATMQLGSVTSQTLNVQPTANAPVTFQSAGTLNSEPLKLNISTTGPATSLLFGTYTDTILVTITAP